MFLNYSLEVSLSRGRARHRRERHVRLGRGWFRNDHGFFLQPRLEFRNGTFELRVLPVKRHPRVIVHFNVWIYTLLFWISNNDKHHFVKVRLCQSEDSYTGDGCLTYQYPGPTRTCHCKHQIQEPWQSHHQRVCCRTLARYLRPMFACQ